MSLWIVLGVIVLIALWAIATYNGLVGGRNQAQTAWSQIDVQLKRRHDLIPNLVQVVKDAMGYEQETLTKVVQARNAAVAASGPAQAPHAIDLADRDCRLDRLCDRLGARRRNDRQRAAVEPGGAGDCRPDGRRQCRLEPAVARLRRPAGARHGQRQGDRQGGRAT